MSERTRVRVIVCATLLSAFASAVLAAFYFSSYGYTTSWGQKIERNEHYLTIEDATITQKDLERIAKLRQLRSLKIERCNVAECRLSDLKFASRNLYRVSFAGTKGLHDLSFLRTLKAEELDLSDCPGIDDISMLNWDVLCYLHVDGTDVTDLSPVATSDLSEITFARTNVSDITPLARAENLSRIDGSYTKVSSLDVLADRAYVWRIAFDGCPITKVDQPFASTFMREISLAQTPVTSLAGFSACEAIRELNLSGCTQLTSMDWLNRQCCETLTVLNVADMGVAAQDLAWIGSCTKLESLTMDGIALEDLSVCQQLDDLTTLSAVGCGLTSVKGIEPCSKLHTLLLGYNNLSSLDGLVSPQDEWPRMTLDLSHNQLESVADLKTGSYLTLLLQGNGTDIGRSLPAGVKVDNLVVPWFSGIEDSRLRDYSAVSHIYLLDCPSNEVKRVEDMFYVHRLTRVTESQLWELLLANELAYWMDVDFTGYVAHARAAAGVG